VGLTSLIHPREQSPRFLPPRKMSTQELELLNLDRLRKACLRNEKASTRVGERVVFGIGRKGWPLGNRIEGCTSYMVIMSIYGKRKGWSRNSSRWCPDGPIERLFYQYTSRRLEPRSRFSTGVLPLVSSGIIEAPLRQPRQALFSGTRLSGVSVNGGKQAIPAIHAYCNARGLCGETRAALIWIRPIPSKYGLEMMIMKSPFPKIRPRDDDQPFPYFNDASSGTAST